MKSMYTLENAGTRETPRYAIMDDSGQYFNDQNRTWVEKGYSLYADANSGLRVIQELLLEKFGKLPTRVFVAPLILHIHTKASVTRDQVEEWLIQVVRIATDPNHRMSLGPVSESLGLLMLDCASLEEVSK